MKDLILNELSKALKNSDKGRVHTLRLIIAAIKDKEIASRSSGEDSEILEETIIQLLKKMVKQRNDSIEIYEKASRADLVKKEKLEITIINEFLPKQLSEEETATICDKAIHATEAINLKEIGKVIKYLKDNSSSSLDMSVASKIIKEKLQK